MARFRIGVDFGGTKIEAAALGEDGGVLVRRRVPTPGGEGAAHYDQSVAAIAELVAEVEQALGAEASVGLGIPGTISPATGLVKNANSRQLNGRPLDRDVVAALGREVRIANDANCFALSEAVDGAGAGRRTVFGVIIGTGCGGGMVVDRQVVGGRNAIAGEWGHIMLPWPEPDEVPGPACWCGLHGCLETMISGTGLAISCDGPDARDASSLPDRAAAGDARAATALRAHASRLARGLAMVVNLLDPDVIVLGGGLSNMAHLYEQLPGLIARHVFSDVCTTPVVRNVHGDSSGVRGAAWLWPVT